MKAKPWCDVHNVAKKYGKSGQRWDCKACVKTRRDKRDKTTEGRKAAALRTAKYRTTKKGRMKTLEYARSSRGRAAQRKNSRLYRERHPDEAKKSKTRFRATVNGFLSNLWYQSRSGSKVRGHAHAITKEDVFALYVTQNGMCPVAKIRMSITADVDDWTKPSLDRVNPKMGYVLGNVRLVCKWVQTAKWTLSDAEMIQWCKIVAAAQ